MADGHGGYRRPTNPAPASGPGALSRRTDGTQPTMDMPNAGYGENAAFREAQAGAPMAQSQPPTFTALDAPSDQPGVPVTNGAAMGPGAGLDAILNTAEVEDERSRLNSYLPVLRHMASLPTATPSLRQLVRQLQSGG